MFFTGHGFSRVVPALLSVIPLRVRTKAFLMQAIDAATKLRPDPHVIGIDLFGRACSTFVGQLSGMDTQNVLK